MIIKRRVTKQFVQLDNAIVRDQRLALDEHGMLHYLLSLPDDWEVNLKQIETFWKIGSRKRKRIFRGLRRWGWVQYERLTDDDGNYIGSRWIVGDEPGAPMDADAFADEEAAEVDETDEDVNPLAATKTDAPESQAPASASHGNQASASATGALRTGRKTHPMQNSTAESRINTSDENRDSTNTTADAARDEIDADGEPPPLFGQVLKLWPADNIASAYACERAFGRLTPWQRKLARDGIASYLADCRAKGQNRLCDLRTYLDERRWEKFTTRGGAPGTIRYAIKRGTPQAMRWRTWFELNDRAKLKLFDMLMATSGAYTAPSEWPPPKDATAA